MPLFGKTLSDYLRFARGVLILTIAVGVTRLLLSLAGAPTSIAVWFSLTGVMLVAMLYFAVRTHTSGFGSYRHLLILLALQILVSEAIVAGGIAITAVTGVENIFSIPEYSGGENPNHWVHAGLHLALGPTLFAAILWVPASVVHFVTKKIVRR